MGTFTAVYQYSHKTMDREKEWFEYLFSSYIGKEINDGEHKVVCDDVIVIDAFIHANDPEYYKQFKGKNAFLMHFADEFYEGHYEIYQNFKGVFRTHWSSVFNPLYVKQLPSGYCKGMDRTLEIPRASVRPYIWSFAGELNKSSRPDMAHAFARVEPHYLFAFDSKVPGYDFRAGVFPERLGDGIVPKVADTSGPPLAMSRIQYQRTLLDSIFSPSPMGSATIEGARTYEALECGSIPIVERRMGLDYYREVLGPHPLPTVRSWPEARDLVRGLIRDPNRLDALQAECSTWWAQKKAALRDEVGAFIEARSVDKEIGERPMVEPKANSNIWRVTELARHHDLRAAGRRAARIASRIVQGKGARAAVAAFKPDSR